MWIIAAVLAALVAVTLGLSMPTLTVAALSGLCLLLVLDKRWHLLPGITLFLAATTLPSQLPSAIGFGGFSFRLYEPVLAIAFVWALSRFSTLNRLTRTTFWLIVSMVGVGLVVAYLNSASLVRVVGDVRFVVEMAMAVIVAAAVARDHAASLAGVKALRVSLWVSAAFTLLASAGVVTLSGRSEAASLGEATSEDVATRILAAATFFALATLCVCIAAAVIGQLSMASSWSWWAPALLVLFLAFSRNHLIGIAVTVLGALIAARSFTRTAKTAYITSCVGLALLAFSVSVPFIADLPGGAWMNSQVESYSSRVIEGFDSTVTSTDSSTVYREIEIERLRGAVEQSPTVGHGYGYAYQKPIGKPGTFFYERAPYYSHNFYWWTLAKTGVVGLLLFLAAALLPLTAAIRDSGPTWGKAVAATFAGFLVICWVAPLPIGAPSSAVIGALLGYLAGLTIGARSPELALATRP